MNGTLLIASRFLIIKLYIDIIKLKIVLAVAEPAVTSLARLVKAQSKFLEIDYIYNERPTCACN